MSKQATTTDHHQLEQTYRNKFAISQSSIKDWRNMPPIKWYQTWITKQLSRGDDTDSISFGSLLDSHCFTPTAVEKRFIVSEVELPSDNIIKVVTGVFKHIKQLNENAAELNKNQPKNALIPYKPLVLDDKELIVSLSKAAEYYVKQPDRAYNEVMKSGPAYFEFLQKTEGKKVITEKDLELAKELKGILFTNPISRGFFEPKKHCEVVFQNQMFADFEVGLDTIEVVPMKGMTDIIHFNHKRKEVREVDLKYTNDAFTFYDAIKRFDYAGQHSVYDFLIREWLKTYMDGKYADYSVMNPLNVVIDDVYKVPYLYEYSPNDLYIKRYGLETESRLVFPGWEHAVKDIAWHLDRGEWMYPKEHVMNGKLQVRIFNK
jgi:hypothetical protein